MSHTILKKALAYCQTHKHRFTEPRKEVLKVIASSEKPLGAYEILKKLGRVMNNPKPPTAYRAIEFWQDHGFIHRIESLNAYMACEAGHRHEGSQFMICDDCGAVIETHLCELPQTLKDSAHKNTFVLSRWNIEMHGLCGKCA